MIVARFIPQAWINDSAVEVDSEGDDQWDVTVEVEAMGREKALLIRDYRDSSDQLQFTLHAPHWVREWSGPFAILVEDSIARHFEEPQS